MTISLSFNNWSIVEAGSPGLTALDGVESIDNVRSGNVMRGRAHGSVRGPLYMGDRDITAEVVIVGTPQSIRTQVDELSAATVINDEELPLIWQLPGMTEARQSFARVHRRSIPVDINFTLVKATAVIQWVATDPRIYGTTLKSGTTGTASLTGGLGFSHGFSHGFGSVTPSTIPIDNDGSSPAPWTATLTGPLTAPRITLIDGATGDLSFNNFTLLAGQTLEIDSQARTVLLNGTASRYGNLTTAQWFDLPVGVSQVQLQATAGTGSLTIRYRNTFL